MNELCREPDGRHHFLGNQHCVTGTDAILGKADGDNWTWTLLCGGNKTSGTINGGTTITLKDIAATTGAGIEHSSTNTPSS